MNDDIRDNDDASDLPEHPFAPYVRITGRGKRARRDYSRQEAATSFAMLLSGQATPAQIGAYLMLLRVKEETPEELAGFIDASRNWIREHHALPEVHIDWPSYAGKKKHHPWYLLAALVLAQHGHRVMMHGGSEHTPERLYSEKALRELGIGIAESVPQAGEQLGRDGFTYLPLRVLCPPLDALLKLRFELGLRSPVNTLTRCINPANAPVTLQSVFHPAYMNLQRGAAELLYEPQLMLFKGEGGEIEIRPDAVTQLHGLSKGVAFECEWPSTMARQTPPTERPSVEPLCALWHDDETHSYGAQAVLQTLAVVLMATGTTVDVEASRRLALEYWQARDRSRL